MKQHCNFFACISDPIEYTHMGGRYSQPFIITEIGPALLREHGWEQHGRRLFCPVHKPSQWSADTMFKEYHGFQMFKFIEGIFEHNGLRPTPIGFKFKDQSVNQFTNDYFMYWNEEDEEYELRDQLMNGIVTTKDMVSVQFFYNNKNSEVRKFLVDIDQEGPSADTIDSFLNDTSMWSKMEKFF